LKITALSASSAKNIFTASFLITLLSLFAISSNVFFTFSVSSLYATQILNSTNLFQTVVKFVRVFPEISEFGIIIVLLSAVSKYVLNI
jgi:hypothetical protein